MKLYIYIFFQLKNYYSQLWEAFISFIAILMINVLSLLFITASIFDFDPGFYRSENYFISRFVNIPLIIILPICLIIFLFYKLNTNRIMQYFEEFKRKRNNRLRVQMIVYLIISGLLFMFSIISSGI